MTLKGLLSDTGKLEKAIEKAAHDKAPGWYRISRISVEKRNPINDYRVELEPDPNPPPP